MSTVLVVGAGVAGAVAAQSMRAAGHAVVVVDKGHVPGGRVATRTVDGAVFDHGAQFLTARSERFQGIVGDWRSHGVVRTWFHGSPDVDAPDDADGHPRFRGDPTMRRIGEHLVHGLDLHLGVVAERLDATGTGWRMSGVRRGADRGAVTFDADAVVLTAPLPQSLALIDAGSGKLEPTHRRELDAIGYDPCIAVLAVPHRSPTLPARGATRLADGDIAWLTDNQQTGASPQPAVTIHASAAFSHAHLDDPDAKVGAALVELARPHLGTGATPVFVHRWRYAAPTGRARTDSILDTSNVGPLAFAGDGLTGGRVEGAAQSGLDAADRIMARLGAPS